MKAYNKAACAIALTASACCPVMAATSGPALNSTSPPLGWSASYYDNPYLSGAPVLKRVDESIDFNWGNGSPGTGVPADEFSVRWQGSVLPTQSGLYRIEVEADDGIQVMVDGKVLISAWKNQSPTKYSTEILFVAGKTYAVLVDYYERGGGAVARVKWGISGGALTPIGGAAVNQNYYNSKIPAESTISPVTLEGVCGPSSLSVVRWLAPASVLRYGASKFSTSIPLTPYLATPVVVKSGSQIAGTGLIQWKATKLAGSSTLELATGESLLFEGVKTSNWRVSHNSGVLKSDARILPCERVPVSFTKPGSYRVSATEPNGNQVADIIVNVTAITIPRTACEIGHNYLRSIKIEGDAPVELDANDGILKVSVKGDTANGVDVWAQPSAHGSPAIVARINGRPVAYRIVDEYTITPDWHHHFMYHVHEDGFGGGHFGFTLSPKIDYVDVTVDFFVPTCTVNGKSKFTIPGNLLDSAGHWEAEFTLAPGANKTCHRYIITQRP